MKWLALLSLATVAQAQNQLVRVASFQTPETAFVDVPGSSITWDAGTNELTLLFWNASLSANGSSADEAELYLEGRNGVRWGMGHVGAIPAGRRMRWSNFDWDVGRPFEVHAKLRATVDGGLARVENFEAVTVSLGPSGAIRTAENLVGGAVTIGDLQWTNLAEVTVPVPLAQPWLCLAQATVEVPNINGVSFRVRVAGTTHPELITAGDERGGFITRGPAKQSFFLATALGTPNLQPNDTVILEGLVNPRVLDGGSGGLSAGLRDVRMMLIPASVLEPVQNQAITGTAQVEGVGVMAPVVSAGPSPLPRGDWELQTFAVMVRSDGGLIEHDLVVDPGVTPLNVVSARASLPGLEQPMLSALVLRQVDGTSPRWWARSPVEPMVTWDAHFSRWRIDAGVLSEPVDAGLDAGLTDAGAAVEDAGLVVEDAGTTPTPGSYTVGCSCNTTSPLLSLALLLSLAPQGRGSGRGAKRRAPPTKESTHFGGRGTSSTCATSVPTNRTCSGR